MEENAHTLMSDTAHPTEVQEAADAVLKLTSQVWHFEPSDAIEAVITKIEKRSPLTFARPEIGTMLRYMTTSEAHWHDTTAQLWGDNKTQRKSETGSSGYTTEVTGTLGSLLEANHTLSDHYQVRRDRHCPLRNPTVENTVQGTLSELEELVEDITAARDKGIADTSQSVMDESGDTCYGAFCYTVAYSENTYTAVKQMKRNWKESQKPQQGTETTNSKANQTRVDHMRWETAPWPVVLSEELLTIAIGPVEKIKMMASNSMDHEAIMASVRTCSEETAAILDMKAGTLMSVAAGMYVVANEESIQGQPTGITEETVRQQRMANTSQLQANKMKLEAEHMNESWDEARERLNTAMMMCRTNKCPAWHKESSHTLKSVKKRARTLIQTMEGKPLTNSETDVKVVTQEDVMMAVIRLITASVQHCETQKSAEEVEPTGAKHIRFVSAASTPKDKDEQQPGSTWHDCIQSPEPEWHDCQEQVWSHAKQQLIARHPRQTTSEIRRMQRERNAEAVTAQYQKSVAALEEAGSDQAEKEEAQRGRGINRAQREDTREQTKMNQESETRVNNRVSAGVAQARREAKRRT